MVRSVGGGHSLYPRMTINKEANVRWVASVLRSTILTYPNLAAKSLKKQLLEKFTVSYDNLIIYRVKKIVHSNLKTDNIASYVEIKKYGNTIIAIHPVTCIKVALT